MIEYALMQIFRKPLQVLVMLPLTFGFFLNGDSQGTPNPFPDENVIAQHEMSLADRYDDKFVNDVFKNNILLNLAYLSERVHSAKDINWAEITQPFNYEFILTPNKTFAFHEDSEDKYKGKIEKTTNAHFNAQEGFKTDGYLFGDGVCHLASLINWVAKDAGLEVEAPTNHDFAKIPDIGKQYGVSIYSNPGSKGSNARQNLYITNNKHKPVVFKFEYKNNTVKVSIIEAK